MSKRDADRIVCLQRCLKIAKSTLARIALNDRFATSYASEALENIQMEELKTKPTPLQGLVGHAERKNP